MIAGPRLRAGLVLVPEIGDSAYTITAYRMGKIAGVNGRIRRKARNTHNSVTMANVVMTSPKQDNPEAVPFSRNGGAERHASSHRAPGQERHAPENGSGKLRHDITEGRPQIELAHQAESQRHDGIDVRAAPFPDRGERDQRTGGAEQEAGDQPAPSFARQDARNGTAFPEHQNHERKADQHQHRRPDQFGTKDQPRNVSGPRTARHGASDRPANGAVWRLSLTLIGALPVRAHAACQRRPRRRALRSVWGFHLPVRTMRSAPTWTAAT